MARTYYALSAYASNDAAFRTQLTQFRNALVTCGLVEVGIPGVSIDLTTVVRGAPAGVVGSFYFRFDDALQATAPVFLRFWIYNLDTTVGCWAFSAYIGTAVDGAGVLSNQSVQMSHNAWSQDNGATRYHYFSGDGSRLMMVSPSTSYSGSFCYLNIERIKSPFGVDTDQGCTINNCDHATTDTHSSGNQTQTADATRHGVWLKTSGMTTQTIRGCIVPATGSGYSYPNKVYVYPWRPFSNKEYAPILGIMAGFGTDLTPGSIAKIATYDGASHDYLVISQEQHNGTSTYIYSSAADTATARYTAHLFRYE